MNVSTRNPSGVVIPTEAVKQTELEEFAGRIIALHVPEDRSDVLASLEQAVSEDDVESGRAAFERLIGGIEAADDSTESGQFDIVYDGTTLASRPLNDTELGAHPIPYDGGSIDIDCFSIRERVSGQTRARSYSLIVVPPTQDSMEADFEAGVPDEVGPAVIPGKRVSATAAILFAAGVAVGAAAAGTGSLTPDPVEATDTTPAGASVAELIEERESALN